MKTILCALGLASAALLSSCATTKTEECTSCCDAKPGAKCEAKPGAKPAADHGHTHATKKKAS